MKYRLQQYIPLVLAIVLGILCFVELLTYAKPMEDVSLDLSLVPQENDMVTDPETFDNKGWSVYTQEGELRTELTPNGFGGYSGLEPGQTFYFSRVLDEKLDSPALQLEAAAWRFSVWLNDDLIYTDCPELDNRIGYLCLPTNDGVRNAPITISLPADYLGKTLTIAQSFPEWAETSRVEAYPTIVRLYCGYAYESSLISETTRTTLLAVLALLLTLATLVVFVRHRDWSTLCLAMVAFLWMVQQQRSTSFYWRYFSSYSKTSGITLVLVSTLFLLSYLTLQGGRYRKWLWVPVGLYALSVIVYASNPAMIPYFTVRPAIVDFLTNHLPLWLAFFCFSAVLVMGTIWWRKESHYYRMFIPLSYAGIALNWILEMTSRDEMAWAQIAGSFASGQVLYFYRHTLPGIIAAVLITTIAEAIKRELDHRAEQHMIEQRWELAISSYENLRHQHEEVMMIRHDMKNHFIILRELAQNPEVKTYLDNLIQDNEKIRPVIQSGNKLFDIILNSKINRAISNGIRVEIIRADVVKELPIPDADLCSLIMNLLDNAIAAASQVSHQPQIELDMHIRGTFFVFTCTNSADPQSCAMPEEDTLKKHGFGLKIVHNIAERYNCLVQTKQSETEYHVTVAIPLDHIPSTEKVYIPI